MRLEEFMFTDRKTRTDKIKQVENLDVYSYLSDSWYKLPFVRIDKETVCLLCADVNRRATVFRMIDGRVVMAH